VSAPIGWGENGVRAAPMLRPDVSGDACSAACGLARTRQKRHRRAEISWTAVRTCGGRLPAKDHPTAAASPNFPKMQLKRNKPGQSRGVAQRTPGRSSAWSLQKTGQVPSTTRHLDEPESHTLASASHGHKNRTATRLIWGHIRKMMGPLRPPACIRPNRGPPSHHLPPPR
jgi:hypothetical protein